MDYITEMESPVGRLTLSSDGTSLTGLWIKGQKYFCCTVKDGQRNDALPLFGKVRKWLELYFAGKQPAIDFPLAPTGSDFRKTVWTALVEIPYGQLTTYGGIARQINARRDGNTTSARAVGGAVGHNPISIIIPCHRVVGAGGSLTGYAGGLKVKTALLKLEKIDMNELYVPAKGTAL